MSEAQKTIFLAVWDHKHGQNVAAHTTENGARKQLVAWARDALSDWLDYGDKDYAKMSDSDLLDNWGEISGYTEYFEVQGVLLNEDAPEEKEKWVADTSHIGA